MTKYSLTINANSPDELAPILNGQAITASEDEGELLKRLQELLDPQGKTVVIRAKHNSRFHRRSPSVTGPRGEAEAERDALRDREKHFASVLSVADGGQYRNDWDAAIRRVVAERDALREALVKADDLARAVDALHDSTGLSSLALTQGLAAYREARAALAKQEKKDE